MLEHRSWIELLWRWSGESIAHADVVGLEATPQRRASGWLGAPPASTTDIATDRDQGFSAPNNPITQQRR